MREPWVGHPREAEFEASFAQHEREMAACTCEWDVDGRTAKRGCVTHAQEDADNGEFDDDGDDLLALIDDAMSTVEARPLDQTFTDCTCGERPRK